MISFSLTNLARSRTANTDWSLPVMNLAAPRAVTEARVVSRPSFLSLFVS